MWSLVALLRPCIQIVQSLVELDWCLLGRRKYVLLYDVCFFSRCMGKWCSGSVCLFLSVFGL